MSGRGRVFGGVVAVALGLLAAAPVRAAEIDALPLEGLVLDQPGTYTVTHDLTYTGDGAAITLFASPVILDLNGHSLSGPGSDQGAFGIYVPSGSGAVIENGAVSGFDFGVLLDLASDAVSVTGITARGNHDGIAVVGSGCTVSGCLAVGNDAVGIVVLEGEGNAITGSTAMGNQNGIAVLNADRNTVSGNTSDGNQIAGLTVSGSMGNTFSGNTAQCNGGADLTDDQACANTWQDNCFGTTDGSPCLGTPACH
jgi:parallel beta-helix repeat protein